VYQAVQEAAARARQGQGPTLIEAVTYRWSGHSEGESAQYRPAEEITAWKAREPIARWKNKLMEAGTLTADQAIRIEQDADAAVETAITFAWQAPSQCQRWSLRTSLRQSLPGSTARCRNNKPRAT
jgi:TPP-dependent pyruvate/acetoin dehydrogenase alpha subunit